MGEHKNSVYITILVLNLCFSGKMLALGDENSVSTEICRDKMRLLEI